MNKLTTRTLQSLTAASALAFALNVHAADATTSAPGATGPAPASESVGQHVDDAALTTKVKSKLLTTGHLSSTHIHVKSHHGVVWLHGSVPTAAEKTLAIETVRTVDGVTNVHSRLRVNAHPDKTWINQEKARASEASSAPGASDSTSDEYSKH